jgi:hypothetical protein
LGASGVVGWVFGFGGMEFWLFLIKYLLLHIHFLLSRTDKRSGKDNPKVVKRQVYFIG